MDLLRHGGMPHTTSLLSDAEQLVFVDVDDTVRQTYGYAKEGARPRLPG
jgi:hypothetical protein